MQPFNIHNQDWQQLIYLALVLIVLLSGLAVRRSTNFGKIGKAIFSWFAIIAGCVVVYAYRFEFAEMKERVMGELNPSSAREVVQSLRLAIDADADGKFFLDAKVDDYLIHFLIDPDLNAVVLNHSDAKKIAGSKSLVLDSSYYDSGRSMTGASVKIDEMTIGDAKIESLDAMVAEEDASYSRLGTTFFERFRSHKFSGSKLVLNDLVQAPGKITIRASSDGQFYMNVLINSVKFRCMIDTGASAISLDHSHAKMLHIDESKQRYDYTIQTANGSSAAARIMLEDLAIGGIKFSNVGAILSKGDMGGVCLLGMEFLRRFKRYESFQDRMILTM